MKDPYPSLQKLGQKTYEPLGYCMYCDSTDDLSDEHIVPFALDGNLILQKSTCAECAKITSRFERKVLRGEFWRMRTHLGIQSRRKHRDAPSATEVEFSSGNQKQLEHFALADGPVTLTLPIFAPPRIILGKPSAPGIEHAGFVGLNFGRDPRYLAVGRGAATISFTDSTHPVQFAQLVAKVAYGMAFATGAHLLLEIPASIRDAIVGKTPNIGDYVGTLSNPIQTFPGQTHRVAIFPDQERGLLIADVQLFCSSQTPRYGVVLGNLRSTT